MNKAMLGVGIILLSVIALILINVLSNYSTGSELDYYLLKETTDAAMIDASDSVFLRDCGVPRMDREKFVESFLYRFAANVDTSRGYEISFYDINEVPPKVSVKVDSSTVLNFNSNMTGEQQSPDITTSYDAIIETNYKEDVYVEGEMKNPNADLCKSLIELYSK